jgi:hypothetical protein
MVTREVLARLNHDSCKFGKASIIPTPKKNILEIGEYHEIACYSMLLITTDQN